MGRLGICVWRPEDKIGCFLQSLSTLIFQGGDGGLSMTGVIFSFYHVGLWGQTQVFRLSIKCLYLLSHLAHPSTLFSEIGSSIGQQTS